MKLRALVVGFLVLCLGVLTACSDASVSATNAPVTYDQIRGTGLANKCPSLNETSRGSIPLAGGKSYTLKDVCLEPTTYFVKEEPANKRATAEFVQGKLVTRQTSSLEQISGGLKVNTDGSLTFKEEDGIDFQAITVKLPGGELVPFLFTIKELVATSQPGQDSINTSTDFKGEFKVPSYRGSVFLDPKGRGVASGYDNAVALPSEADSSDLTRANVKRLDKLTGKISLQVAKVDNSTGEVAGTFESEQPSDTDLGVAEAKEVKVRGVFYGRIENLES
jgi:photosystem II oxygen-evolving enhancer protein 1